MTIHPRLDAALMALLGVMMGAAVLIALAEPDTFTHFFAAEDGPVEYGTALFLLFGAAALVGRAIAGRETLGAGFAAFSVLYAALFFFAAGEEISWGQRILGLETTGIFLEHNDQQELTLHNMVVWGVKLDEAVFGNLLSVVLLSYLIGLPLLWPRFAWARRVSEWLAVPVPRTHHALATVLVSVIIVTLQIGRKWEVYECAFALLALGIFVHPRNEPSEARSGVLSPV